MQDLKTKNYIQVKAVFNTTGCE